MNFECAFKVTVVGCGSVGATAAYALLLDGIPTDLALIDVNKEKAEGIMLDLEHSLAFTSHVKLEAGDDYRKAQGSHLVVITAGKRQADGETRLDLVRANKKIFQEIIPKLVKAAPDALFLIVTNPVDVLTHEALKVSRLPLGRVFGTGTTLDTARLQFHISQKLKIHPQSVDAYIFGEHGDTSFPVWSSANILGKPLLSFDGFSQTDAQKCYEDTKNAAYRIIHDVGYTCYSIGTVIREITRAILEDRNQVFMLSTRLQNYYGQNDVCLSVPCVLGRGGITKVLCPPLNEEEQGALAKSASVLKGFQ